MLRRLLRILGVGPRPSPLDALREQIVLPRDFEKPVPYRPADRRLSLVPKPFGLLTVV
jgi:hypothetical protein